MLRILRALPILALVAAFAGFTQVRLDTDTLSLLPAAVPGVAELQRLNAHLADERTLVLLVEPKDIDNAEEEVAAVLDAVASAPGTRSVRDAMEGPAMEGNFAELAAYLTLNQSETDFAKQMEALQKEGLAKTLQAARATLATTFDGLEAAHAGHDPLGFTRHPVFRWLESGLATAEEHESGVRVLLAEDNEPNLRVACALLRSSGFDVEVAKNGQQVLTQFETDPRDVVLLDVNMPIIDGLEATRRLRATATGRSVPIIGLTANASIGDRQKCLDAGMNEHMPKPVDWDRLIALLTSIDRELYGTRATLAS